MKSYYVYILASKPYGTLYIGVTNNLEKRLWEHQNDLAEGFTRKYGVHRLVYFEETSNVLAAIEREKQLKRWNRDWKVRLIEKLNPEWLDLSIHGFPPESRGNDNGGTAQGVKPTAGGDGR